MCKYDMDLASIAEDIEWTSTDGQTYRQMDSKLVYPPLNFIGGGYNQKF